MTGRVLVTGASGFVGRALVAHLVAGGVPVRGAVRRRPGALPRGVDIVEVGDIGGATDWSAALAGIDTVVHCAARVHQLSDASTDPLAAFREVNREGTLALGRAAARSGASRLVFLSSIGVNGAETFGRAFCAEDAPAPCSAYAISKREGEDGLRAIGREAGLKIVVVRAPLVYGPGAPGNFAALLRAVKRGFPLPLGAIANQRSLVSIYNLVDLIRNCTRHDRAAGQTLLVSDGEDLSTTDLLRRTAKAFGVRPRLLPVPTSWLRLATDIAGRPEIGQRLCGSLQIDISATRERLAWSPPMSVDEALAATARGHAI